MKKHVLQKPVVVALLAFLCCAIWGSAHPSIKTGYRLFEITSSQLADQIIFAGERFTLSGVLVFLTGSLLERRLLLPKRSSWGHIALIGVIQTTIQYVFFYIGIAHTSAVRSAILSGASTFFTVLLASVFFRDEKLTFNKMAGCLLGLAGVVLINLTGIAAGSFSFIGEGFLLISGIAYAISSNLTRIFTQTEHPVMLSAFQFLLGGLGLIAVGLLFGGHFHTAPPAGYAVLLYLGFIAASAYTLWGILLKYNPVSSVSVYLFSSPIFGVLLSVILLGEMEGLNLRTLAALILISFGIWLVNRQTLPAEA